MKRRLALLILTLWLGCGPALGDPGTVGALIVGAEVASTVIAGSLTIGQVVGFVAITAITTAASIGVQAALQKRPDSVTQAGQFVTRQPTPSRRRNYGRVKVSGATIFSEVGTISSILTLARVIALNQGEIDAFEEFWLDDNHVLLDGVTSGNVLGAYMVSGATFVAMDSRRGLSTESAYPLLTANFSSIWTASHRGDGVASVLVLTGQPTNFNNLTTAYPGASAPNPRCVIRAAKVWNSRNVSQNKDNPATWTWTDSAVDCILDLHRHPDGMGMSVFDATLFTSAALIADWGPAADICDETVGGIPRYRIGGGYSIAEDAPADVLAGMLAACDGQTYQRSDGSLGVRVGKNVAPAITLTDDHILGYTELKKGDDVFLACNEVTAKYTSPAHDYQLVDADPWRDEADITDRGHVLTKAIALPWVNHHSQCRRLMKIAHARFNPEWQGRIVTDAAGASLLNERYVHLTISEAGLNLIDRDFEIVPDSFQLQFTDQGVRCSFAVLAMDQSAYDWDEGTEAGTPPAVPPPSP